MNLRIISKYSAKQAKLINEGEKKVSQFYNTIGWEIKSGITEDSRRWEDLREHAKEYVKKCRLRVLRHIPNSGENILDMASGPIQYEEYLAYSRNFKKRYCVDFSLKAIDDAKKKIGDHGVFLCQSFFDVCLIKDFFDCTISLHTIYHFYKDRQEEAVRKLIRVTKAGKPIIIVYANPHSLIRFLSLPFRVLRKIYRVLIKREKEYDLYYFAHPIKWWDRFRDVADMQIVPWRSFSAQQQKRIIPNNIFGKKVLDILFDMEERFPNFFVKHFEYPMIILMKKS